MKKIALLAAILLQGCGAIECLDAKVDRPVISIEREFAVEFEFQNRRMTTKIKCEKYYDAICAERGNFWAIREVGQKSEYDRGDFEFSDGDLGKVQFPFPLCKNMVTGEKEPLAYFVPRIEGEPYWLRGSDGDIRTYGSGKKALKARVSIKVDGVPIN